MEYFANRKLPIAFYLAALVVFATLLGSYLILAIVTSNELTRNEMILTCVSSFLGLALSIYGLYNPKFRGSYKCFYFLTHKSYM